MGGGTRLGRPVPLLSVDCCGDVNRKAASSSDSAATTVSPSIKYDVASCAEGRKRCRYMAIASIIIAGAKCEAKANGNPMLAIADAAEEIVWWRTQVSEAPQHDLPPNAP